MVIQNETDPIDVLRWANGIGCSHPARDVTVEHVERRHAARETLSLGTCACGQQVESRETDLEAYERAHERRPLAWRAPNQW